MIFPIKTILETWITYDSPFCMMVDVGPCFQPGPKHIGVHRHIHILQCAPAKGALRIERERVNHILMIGYIFMEKPLRI